MLRTTPAARWIISALLAVWIPVCCCEASGLLRMVWEGLAAKADGAACCCSCSDKGEHSPSAPIDGDCDDACCNLGVKIAASQRPLLPDLDAGVPLPPPVAQVVCVLPGCALPAPAATQLARTPAPTLLRLHCALTI